MARSDGPRARGLIGPYALFWLYRRRLRAHRSHELLAGVGVAIAVALVFATTVAAGSIAGSAGEVVHAVAGPASLQLHARTQAGFSARLLGRVQRLPGVRQAAPLLEQTATVVGPRGVSVTVDLAGADLGLVTLDGLAHTLPRSTLESGGVGLSAASAQRLGLARRPAGSAPGSREVWLELDGTRTRLRVSAVLGAEAFGALAQASVAVMPLEALQRLAGLSGRVSRILVQTAPHRTAAVARALRRMTAGQIEVAPADQDVALLRQALRPSDQASAFFAVVSSLLGLLLAFNALLLTLPERRRAIADLRLIGVRRTAIAQMLLFQALALAALSSLVGLACGYLISVHLLQQSPRYLTEAFTLGARTIVGPTPVLLALAAGLMASCAACALPLLDLRAGRAIDVVAREHAGHAGAGADRTRRRLALCCVALLAAASALFALAPGMALICCVLLAATAMLSVPFALAAALRSARAISERWQRLTILPVALSSLRGVTPRSLALAGTGAVALFGSVSLGGARGDLTHGIDRFAASYSADASIWVGSPRDYQSVVALRLGTLARRIARLPGVSAVRPLQGTFVQLDGRRVWLLARAPGTSAHLLSSQALEGDPRTAARRLAQGPWVTISKQIAEALHTHVGGTIALPTPSGPRRLSVAATTTNLAWSPGAIVIGAAEYRRLWHTDAPTALAVQLRPGASPGAALAKVRSAIGGSGGLQASTAAQRAARIDALAGEGLGQLADISTLMLIAAVLAMGAALTSAIWQRRTMLASLRLAGVAPSRLRMILLVEAALMLGAGCATGALAGVYGRFVIDSYLARVTGFPVASPGADALPLETFALASAIVLALVCIPGWLASRVSPTLAFDEP